MKRTTLAVCGLFTCLAGILVADGYSESDRAFIAGKGIFPGDDDDDSEGVLPESQITNPPNSTAPKSTVPTVPPPDKTPQPQAGKDFFPDDDDGS